jgi:RNA polymerase sigma-70 factor (ECF subfamily)
MQQHGQSLVTMLWRILGNEQDVCDAYQDTFVRLANRLTGCKPRNSKAFVYTVAGNIAISLLRRRRMQEKACRRLAGRAREDYHPSSEGELDSRRLQEILRDQILSLPENLRNVVVLKDIGELPYAQVGAILGISSAAARVNRHRAIQLLATRMAREGGG